MSMFYLGGLVATAAIFQSEADAGCEPMTPFQWLMVVLWPLSIILYMIEIARQRP